MITYVGRVSDFRKGLQIFLDALQILFSAHNLPVFIIQIVGGDESEAAWVRSTFGSVPILQQYIENGRIRISSRFEPQALPEIYSRSTVLCGPSLREQFGIVAIEAMMCGTPVVAARVGGLAHIVLSNFNGYLVERLSSGLLASALSLFIRNDKLSRWMGKNASFWAHAFFKLDTVAHQYIELYEGIISGTEMPQRHSASYADIHDVVFSALKSDIESHIQDSVMKWRDVSSSPSPSFVATTSSGELFVKIYQDRPYSLTCYFSSDVEKEAPPLYKERIRKSKMLSRTSLCPEVVVAEEQQGILIQEFLTPFPVSTVEDAESHMLAASKALAELYPVSGEQGVEYGAALQNMKDRPSRQSLDAFDQAVAELAATIWGGDLRLRKCHPQVELFRIACILHETPWLVPSEFRSRALGTVCFLLSQRDTVMNLPKFAHGDMKPQHLLMRPSDRQLVVCDLDQAGLYVGPRDVANWSFHAYRDRANPAPRTMLKTICRNVADTDERFLGVAWLASTVLYSAIWRYARGDRSLLRWHLLFLACFPDAVRNELTL